MQPLANIYFKRHLVTLGAALFALVFPSLSVAQQPVTMDEAVSMAVAGHPAVRSADSRVKEQRLLQKSAFAFKNPELEAEKERASGYSAGLRQDFSFPGVYKSRLELQKNRTELAFAQKDLTVNDLKKAVRLQYLEVQYLEAQQRELSHQDSVYRKFERAAKRNFEAGQTDYLQKIFIETRALAIQQLYQKIRTEHSYAVESLRSLTGDTSKTEVTELSPLTADADTGGMQSPLIKYFLQSEAIELKELELQRKRMLPDFFVGVQTREPMFRGPVSTVRAGISVPLWFWQTNSGIQAARQAYEAAKHQTQAEQRTLDGEMARAYGAYRSLANMLNYYRETGLRQAKDIENTASRLYESGASDYITYVRSLEEAYTLRLKYLETLRDYNASIVTIQHLKGK